MGTVFDKNLAVHEELNAVIPLVESMRNLVSRGSAQPEDLAEFSQLLNMLNRRVFAAGEAYQEMYDYQQNYTETEDR